LLDLQVVWTIKVVKVPFKGYKLQRDIKVA